jgi:hypothetical protein
MVTIDKEKQHYFRQIDNWTQQNKQVFFTVQENNTLHQKHFIIQLTISTQTHQ